LAIALILVLIVSPNVPRSKIGVFEESYSCLIWVALIIVLEVDSTNILGPPTSQDFSIVRACNFPAIITIITFAVAIFAELDFDSSADLQ
jgi:uncharacterized membrane protein (DUF4010 family)